MSLYDGSNSVCRECGQYGHPWWNCVPRYKMGGAHDPFAPYIDPHILPPSDPRAQATGVHPVLGKIKGTLIESREQRRAIMKEQNLDWAGRSHDSGGMEI